ncbi:MAG: hypothetical protein MJZ11_08310 [Lachnospiraceae bacterium]|nr:hypothetical protein [Lachnospiraceae bacterium]
MVRVRVFVGGKFITLVFSSCSQFEKWLGGSPNKIHNKGVIKIMNYELI